MFLNKSTNLVDYNTNLNTQPILKRKILNKELWLKNLYNLQRLEEAAKYPMQALHKRVKETDDILEENEFLLIIFYIFV